MPKAVLKIDARILGRVLHFPEGHEAVFARIGADDCIELLVEGPSFRAVREGEMLPRVNLVVTERPGEEPAAVFTDC